MNARTRGSVRLASAVGLLMLGSCEKKWGVNVCPEAWQCGAEGDTGVADAGSMDAAVLDGSTDAAIDTRMGYDIGPLPDVYTVCADVHLDATPVAPTVIMLVDQSGSMGGRISPSDARQRWPLLQDALINETSGLLHDLEGVVRFGLVMYSARVTGPDDAPVLSGVCPLLSTVSPMLNNFDEIAAVYGPARPIDQTPTPDAINAVVDDLIAHPPSAGTPSIVLVTDGEPDTCTEFLDDGQEESVAAAARAHDNGINLYVLGVATDVSRGHLQDVANAGVGLMGGADAPYWTAEDDATLRDALSTIVTTTLSCEVDLNGAIDVEMACAGQVRLNGTPITCNDPNGWVIVDDNTILLQGSSCELAQAGSVTLDATFPCEVVID